MPAQLGPSDKQQEVAPCPEGSGVCQEPFGAAFLSHIYGALSLSLPCMYSWGSPTQLHAGGIPLSSCAVNPGGREGNSSDLVGSALQIREVFRRMGMNDSEVCFAW